MHPYAENKIIFLGKPSPLTGCQIINRTLYSLKVECHEGEII